MRNNCIYCLALVLLISIETIANESDYSFFNKNIQITPNELTNRGDSLYIDFSIGVNAKELNCSGSIDIIPYLFFEDKVKELPAVLLKTRSALKMYNRQMLLSGSSKNVQSIEPYSVTKLSKSPIQIDYQEALVFESWMKDAQLGIYIDECGCRKKDRQEALLMNGVYDANFVYMPEYQLSYITPAVEELKIRNISLESYLDFVVNKTDILPTYRNNTAELRKITDLISEVRNDNSVAVRSIEISGYASPEGSIANNKRLSEGRAGALANYLSALFDYPKNMYSIHYGGENWKGLADYLVASKMEDKEQLLTIINQGDVTGNDAAVNQTKAKLRDFDQGKPYQFLLKEVYPSLRKAVCKVDFEVKNFNAEEAKEILKTRPQNLSLNEMFMVANTYEAGSEEFSDVFETAVRLYPTNATANLNAANAALAREDLTTAARYLRTIQPEDYSPQYYNTWGIIVAKQGKLEEAAKWFAKAQEGDLPEATTNTIELNKVNN